MSSSELDFSPTADQENSVCQEHDVASLDVGASTKHESLFSPRNVLFFSLRATRVLLQPFAIVIFWLGAWNLFDYYIFPNHAFYVEGFVWRDLSYVLLGSLGLLGVKIIWHRYKFEDEKDKFGHPKFGWRPRLWRYLRLIATMLFGALYWCGAWNFFDAVINTSWWREVLYILAATILLFVLEVPMRSSSLRHILKIKSEKN